MMSNVVVTGGAGFIGSWLCEYLLERGHKVICVDDLSTGSEENVRHLRDNQDFTLIKADVTAFDYDGEVDQIYHLASRASPIHYQEKPVETALSGSMGTYNMLKLAEKNNATMMFSSTSEVYGDPAVHPQTEDYWGNVNPIGVRSCYDESKRFGEALMMAYKRQHNAKIKIVRIFNTYGPRMAKNDGRVIPNFINQAIRNQPITIYGDGTQTRSYCYVEDMVKGLYAMMSSDLEGPVNLGNPVEFSIMETAGKIRDITKSSSEIVHMDLPEDDPKKRHPEIARARKYLGWEPAVGFEEGIMKTVEYFRNSS